jgi:hypothetical protein
MDGVRLSQMAKCRRMAAYGALGTLEDDRLYDPEESFFRGKVFEAVAAERLAAEYGREFDGAPNVERQVRIPWPLGEGHADAYVRSERLGVECKSSTSDSDIPLVDGMIQAALYFYFHPDAKRWELWYFDPRKGIFKPMRVAVERPDADQVAVWVEEVRVAQEGGDLPPRVCSHPKMAPDHFCPFVGECFSTWSEPVEHLERDDESKAEDLAMQWLELKNEEGEHATQAKHLQSQRKELEERLRELVPVGKTEAGDVRITRIQVGESFSLPLKKAIATGLWTDAHNEQFGQLISTRRGHERFAIERVDDDASPEVDDAGDVPF